MDISCCVPSLFLYGEGGYTAPQAARPVDDDVVVVGVVPRERAQTSARTASPELLAAVRDEFLAWPMAERTSISLWNTLRSRGKRWSQRQVYAALDRLRLDGELERRTNPNRKIPGRWLWRRKT